MRAGSCTHMAVICPGLEFISSFASNWQAAAHDLLLPPARCPAKIKPNRYLKFVFFILPSSLFLLLPFVALQKSNISLRCCAFLSLVHHLHLALPLDQSFSSYILLVLLVSRFSPWFISVDSGRHHLPRLGRARVICVHRHLSSICSMELVLSWDFQSLSGPSEALPIRSEQRQTDKAALEAGRLSPVVNRKENDCLGTMEGLNPERARRLLAPRSPSMPPNNVVAGPRKTGSNNIALGKPGSQKLASIKKECSPSLNETVRPPLVRISKPAPPVIAGAKRPRDHLDEPQEPHLRRQWPSSLPVSLLRK